jgi:hypothetical protein
MYEGFSSYDDFAASIGDGFTTCLNDHCPNVEELLCSADGYSLLCAVFGSKLSANGLRAVKDEQVAMLQEYLEEHKLRLSKLQVLDCLRGALRQSIGESQLDNFKS